VKLQLELPDAQLDEIAERAAQIVLSTIGGRGSSEFLTVAEAADLLRAKKQRVYDLLSANRLTRYRDGTRVLLARTEIDDYLTGGKNSGLPPRPDRG
jgi:excisionase family DNA binding protein